MSVYQVRGLTAATAATADHALFGLWNPDASKRIRLLELGLFKSGAGAAGDSVYLTRSTMRGTAGSTVTPDADNAYDADDVPASGALLDLAAYSAQPTLATPPLWGWVASAVAGAGVIWPCSPGIVIPPGAGLVVAQRVATAWPASEVYLKFDE